MFENYYNQLEKNSDLENVINILKISIELDEKIEKKDFSIINFDGEEFMKFYKYFIKVYLSVRQNIFLASKIHIPFYNIMVVSLQVDYTINEIENETSNIIIREYMQIKKKQIFDVLPLNVICNFFAI